MANCSFQLFQRPVNVNVSCIITAKRIETENNYNAAWIWDNLHVNSNYWPKCNNLSITLNLIGNIMNVLIVFSSFGALSRFPPIFRACSTTCLSCWHQLSRGDWQACWLAFTSRLKTSHAAAGLACVPASHPSPTNAPPCRPLPRAVNMHLGVSIQPALWASESTPLIFSYQTQVLPLPV